MSLEENKAIDLRFFEEVVNKGNLAVVDELVAANFVQHDAPPGITPDREGMKQFFSAHHSAFPDFHSTLEDMFDEGEKVVEGFREWGRKKGEWMGIAPTGKQITITGIAIHRIIDGKIVDDWTSLDMLGALQQIGVVPPPGQAGG
jgi:predicted ester cyclase